MKYFTFLLVVWSLLVISLQHEPVYRIKLNRALYPRMRKEYAEGIVWISKPNRYTNALNGEIHVYIVPWDTKVKLKMYEFLSNEYRPFAINLERHLCSFMELEYKMILYPDLIKTGSIAPEPRCPVKPGNYTIVNMTLDDVNYPPTLPFHNFMMDLSYWHGSVEMGALQFYGTFDRDAVIREQYG